MDYPITHLVNLSAILGVIIDTADERKRLPTVLKYIYDIIPEHLTMEEYKKEIDEEISKYFSK